jgi:7-carboxy-7-deazaguanine synthase
MPSSVADRSPTSPRLKPLAGLGPDELRVSEIFTSLQGESTLAGLPTVFVRLTACDLRCNYCDAAHAFAGGQAMTIEGVLAEVKRSGISRVCLTGGEPLLQAALPRLAEQLRAAGCAVSCETHGGIDIDLLPAGVSRIVDLKTPGSGEGGTFLEENLPRLRPGDELKFVLSDRADYEWARERVRSLPERQPAVAIHFSPVWGRLSTPDLADWILADRLNVRLQLQLHKIIWGENTRK